MKLLIKLKESFIDNLKITVTEVVRVQTEISKSLWPGKKGKPKRKVEGYWPKGFYLPKSITKSEKGDIRDIDDITGHSYFSTLSRVGKTHYLFKKFLKPAPPLMVPSKSNRGSWYVPCYSSAQEDLRINNRANRYLAHQERRILQAIKEGNYDLSTRIWSILAQKSWCFRVSSLNATKCTRGWYYMMPKAEFSVLISRISNIMREWSCNVKYFRVYIPKPDKVRFRPLGVPSKAWAVVLHMIYSYLVLVIKDRISERQYGFLPKRNGVQAWRKILEMRKQGYKHMYEFDLDACFNRISISWTLKLLSEIGLPKYFVYYLENLLTAFPIAQEIKEEKELTKHYQMRSIGSSVLEATIVKAGLPQGFNISPLLSILVIDHAFKAIGLDPILYADDGIIMSREKTDLTEEQINMLSDWGLVLTSKMKKDGTPGCKWIDDVFTFLGIIYSVKRDAFYVKRPSKDPNKDFDWVWIPSNQMTDDMFWEDLTNEYERKEWSWKIDPKCYALSGRSSTSISNWQLMQRWINGSKMIQRCGMMFIDIQKESSNSSAKLLISEKRRAVKYAIKNVKMLDKYELPYQKTYIAPLLLPTLKLLKEGLYEGVSRSDLFNPTIIKDMSLWLSMDLNKRDMMYEKVYGWYKLAENNITMWRDHSLINKWNLSDGRLVYYPEYHSDFSWTGNSLPNLLTVDQIMSSVRGDTAKEIEEGQLALRLKQDMWDEYKINRPEEARIVEEWQDNITKTNEIHREDNHITRPSQSIWNKLKTLIFGLVNGTGTLHRLIVNSPKPPTNGESPRRRVHGKNVITCFVSSFLLTFFYLYYNSPAYEPSSEPFITPESVLDDWLWWIMIIVMTLVFGTIWLWYVGIVVIPKKEMVNPNIEDYDRSLEILRETNNHLTSQVYELGNLVSGLREENFLLTTSLLESNSQTNDSITTSESLRATVELLQNKLMSVTNTLTVVRQENLNLNSNLIVESRELVRTNKLIEISQDQVQVLLEYLNRLRRLIDIDDIGVSERLSQAQVMLNDSPILHLLQRISQYSDLDITSATLVRTQGVINGDDILVFTDEATFGAIMDGLSYVHSYIEANPFL